MSSGSTPREQLEDAEQDVEEVCRSKVRLKRVWAELDYNQNGKVSFRELEEFARKKWPLLSASHRSALHAAFKKTVLGDSSNGASDREGRVAVLAAQCGSVRERAIREQPLGTMTPSDKKRASPRLHKNLESARTKGNFCRPDGTSTGRGAGRIRLGLGRGPKLVQRAAEDPEF